MGMFDWFRKKPVEQPAKKSRRGAYNGALVSRLTNDFKSYAGSADSLLRFSLRTLKNRCRDLQRNNDHARRFISLLVTNVIGPQGIRLQSNARFKNGRLNEPLNKVLESEWARFCSVGEFTTDKRSSFHDALCLFIRTWAVDGEILIQKVRSNRFRFGVAFKFLDPDLLDEEYNTVLSNGNQVRMGIELNEYGEPVAYHIFTGHPHDYEYTRDRKRVRVPAGDIIHAFIQERPGQTRGLPPMVSTMIRLKMLGGYEEAELVASRVAASKGGFFQSPDGDGYAGEEEPNGDLVIDAEPGVFQQLPAGMEFVPYDPKHPQTSFAEFEKAVLRGIASGLGVSYNSLANDLEGVNYSSIRHGSLEERDHYATLQKFVIDHFCQPVFDTWLSMVLDFDLSGIRGDFDTLRQVTWRARGWKWVDPLKEIKAHVEAINAGLETKQDVAAAQGRDYREIVEQIQAEKMLEQDLGVDMGPDDQGGTNEN